MRVAVVGAGLGGLCLAGGLRRAGIDVVVYERGVGPADGRQGFRINLDDDGLAALRGAIPPSSWPAVWALSHRQDDPRVELRRLADDTVLMAREGSPTATAVDRTVLRRVLACGLRDVLRTGREVVAVDPDGPRLRFADGSTVVADLVVGADGPASVVRRALAPGSHPEPVGIDAVYGQAPVAVARHGGRAGRHALTSRFTGLVDDAGTTLALGAWRPRDARHPAVRAAGIDVSDVAPYLMWAVLYPTTRAAGTPPEIVATLLDGWPAGLRRIVDAGLGTAFGLRIRAHRRVPDWPSGSVTLLGDAAHTLTPARGQGANQSLMDAARLTAELSRCDATPDGVRSAVAAYETDLRDRAAVAIARADIPQPTRETEETHP